MIKYFLGTVEIDRGGGYCVEHFLFTCYQERPGKKLWRIVKDWYPGVSEIDETRKLAYFKDWTIAVKAGVWLEITQGVYENILKIIPEVNCTEVQY